MNKDLTDRQSRIARLIWYAFLLFCISVLTLTLYASAVDLSIIGNSTGTGTHVMSFAGDMLNISILQGNNSSTWQILAGGRA